MKLSNLLAASLLVSSVLSGQRTDAGASSKGEERIVREVRHELVMLPYYSVFDNLAYKVNGYTVTLEGQVTNPVIKTDAEKAVKKIEGVQNVVNNIEVLPLSPMDDQIRRAVYRAVYGQPGLEMYSLRAVPTIHILVKNGHVTLTGAVGNAGDKERAGIAANGVPNVFSVTNDLLVNP
ncbi:MAG TPA: BON domain-containing protein [Bryobacteraceae bacterium]|nr:BON domain-containing protein [Bryobacteraceae bacterium]